MTNPKPYEPNTPPQQRPNAEKNNSPENIAPAARRRRGDTSASPKHAGFLYQVLDYRVYEKKALWGFYMGCGEQGWVWGHVTVQLYRDEKGIYSYELFRPYANDLGVSETRGP